MEEFMTEQKPKPITFRILDEAEINNSKVKLGNVRFEIVGGGKLIDTSFVRKNEIEFFEFVEGFNDNFIKKKRNPINKLSNQSMISVIHKPRKSKLKKIYSNAYSGIPFKLNLGRRKSSIVKTTLPFKHNPSILFEVCLFIADSRIAFSRLNIKNTVSSLGSISSSSDTSKSSFASKTPREIKSIKDKKNIRNKSVMGKSKFKADNQYRLSVNRSRASNVSKTNISKVSPLNQESSDSSYSSNELNDGVDMISQHCESNNSNEAG